MKPVFPRLPACKWGSPEASPRMASLPSASSRRKRVELQPDCGRCGRAGSELSNSERIILGVNCRWNVKGLKASVVSSPSYRFTLNHQCFHLSSVLVFAKIYSMATRVQWNKLFCIVFCKASLAENDVSESLCFLVHTHSLPERGTKRQGVVFAILYFNR